MSRLLLGPIVGHTDHESTRIWIRLKGNVSEYTLRIRGRGTFPFKNTESGEILLGTAIAEVHGLRPDWQYHYQIMRRGRVVGSARGSFSTMPPPGSMADMLFVTISCNHNDDIGAWKKFAEYIKTAKPRFLLMIGDQVYQDSNGAAVWQRHLNGEFNSPSRRRLALAETYQNNWSRAPIPEIMANIPTYMVWDDHDIRDGWGSWASDSATLAQKYTKGQAIFKLYNQYFEDAREVCWHFQMCHNSLDVPRINYKISPPVYGASPAERRGFPVIFETGRLSVICFDGRGARDLWRESNPIIGDEQWKVIDEYIKALPPEIDAVAIITPVPIVAASSDGVIQKLLGNRDEDIELFRKGKLKELKEFQSKDDSTATSVGTAGTGLLLGVATSSPKFGFTTAGNLFGIRTADIDDCRDQWCNHYSRPEQEKVIRTGGSAIQTNRPGGEPRGLIFIGGDLHSGGVFSIDCIDFSADCLISSGISAQNEYGALVGVLVDSSFTVAPGISAQLKDYTRIYNFGVTQVLFGAGTPTINVSVAREGNDTYGRLALLGIDTVLEKILP